MDHPRVIRQAIRQRRHTGHTVGLARGYVQGNVCILPQEYAEDVMRQHARAHDASRNPLDVGRARCAPLDSLDAQIGQGLQTPGLLVNLIEMNANYRMVFLDGRPLPDDPVPSWQGYSSAKWEGDTLVIDSNGFRDDIWIDWNGSMITSVARVRERIRRPDFGHLEIEVTVDDSKAYTKPWTVTLKQQIAVDTELVDEICLENEQSYQRMK